jgi:hypothetical protein
MSWRASKALGKHRRMLAKPDFVGRAAVTLRGEILHGLVSVQVIHSTPVANLHSGRAGDDH